MHPTLLSFWRTIATGATSQIVVRPLSVLLTVRRKRERTLIASTTNPNSLQTKKYVHRCIYIHQASGGSASITLAHFTLTSCILFSPHSNPTAMAGLMKVQ